MNESDYSDSDSDYNENEKILLDKYRKRKYESEDEDDEAVFNVAPDDDSDDMEDELAASDIEGQEDDDDLPDERAWGRNKKAFYSSDYVNPNSNNEKDLELAELEEEGALKLAGELYGQLDSATPYGFDNNDENDEDDDEKETRLTEEEKDISSNLISDLKEYISLYQSFLKPFKLKEEAEGTANFQLSEFVSCYSEVILNYIVNVLFYFNLKAGKETVINHPIIQRLQKCQENLNKLQPVFQCQKGNIETFIKNQETNTKSSKPSKKKLKVQHGVLERPVNSGKKILEKSLPEQISEVETEQNNMEEQTDELTKRPITYKMAKNKGLTPHRKKEQRNPRVKHRNKYKKAKIRRKGAVREVRTETSSYGGERSGININVLKGRKFKV